jgi:hypothetical protein
VRREGRRREEGREKENGKRGKREKKKREGMGGREREKGRERGRRVGAGRGGDRGRSATRAVFARGEREKKGSHVGANHGGRSRVSDKPSSGAERNSDPVRVRVFMTNDF